MDNKVFIVSATRSPIGNLCGAFATLKAHEIGSQVIKSAISQAGIQPSDITEVILGQCLTGGQGQNPARQASIGAGLTFTTPAYSVNMLCGSGLKAVGIAYQTIQADPEAVIVAGGQESMTQAPHVKSLRNPTKMGNVEFIDSMVHDGLTDAFNNIHMGQTAENIVKQFKIERSEQDGFAVESQRRVEAAVKDGLFQKEITAITIAARGKTIVVENDEFPRPGTTIESLGKLRPAFDKNGTVTAGNASGINDGAAVLVLASARTVADKKLTPRARVVGFEQSGVDPLVMGLGPITAVQKLLKRLGWSKDDVDLYELNEAFAAQSLAVVRELQLDPAKVNVNGGALALGHPIGASGARVLVTLLHAMEQRKAKRGIAALCVGGGMGVALAIELC